MKISALMIATMTLIRASCPAQDRPLGDVARETRAQTSRASAPAKVLTNEETNGRTITANDDPLEVVTQAATAMLRDTSHRCRKVVSGRIGDGLPQVTVTEIAGADRIRIIQEKMYPKHIQGEEIIIGNDGYRRAGNGPWERIGAMELAWLRNNALDSLRCPDVMRFGYKNGDLKLIGTQILDGSPAFQYRFTSHNIQINRTINIWVGRDDNLPRKTEMLTDDLQMKNNWQEITSCTFGVNVQIEPPLPPGN